jgi:hyperosmotically inducible periplasmic protein
MKGSRLSMGLALLLSFAGIDGLRAQDMNPSAAASVSAANSVPSAREARLANRRLAKAVRSRLGKLKGVEVLNIIVVAKDGRITLGGSVPSADQIEPVVAATRATPGVESVNNSLRIKAPGQ